MAGKVALLLWGTQSTQLLVKTPGRPPVLWDRVTLTCQGLGTTGATTWYKDGQRWWPEGPDHFTVTESGTYKCERPGTGLSPPVSVLDGWLVLQVSAQALLEGDTVTLRCRVRQDALVTGVRFYHEEKDLWGPQKGTKLSLSTLQQNHSGRYHCEGQISTWTSQWWQKSPSVTVTVLSASPISVPAVPVANVTITPSPPAHQVRAGDPVTLRCSVQVGSAPVNFTWLHNGQEVAQGPLLEFEDFNEGHSGAYQCMATNQLGQDGHRVFRALSPELALTVTPWVHWYTVAAGVSGSLLFLDLLVGVIVAWHRWHRMATRKHHERALLQPPAPQRRGRFCTPTS